MSCVLCKSVHSSLLPSTLMLSFVRSFGGEDLKEEKEAHWSKLLTEDLSEVSHIQISVSERESELLCL